MSTGSRTGVLAGRIRSLLLFGVSLTLLLSVTFTFFLLLNRHSTDGGDQGRLSQQLSLFRQLVLFPAPISHKDPHGEQGSVVLDISEKLVYTDDNLPPPRPSFDPQIWKVPPPIIAGDTDERPDIATLGVDPTDFEFVNSGDRLRNVRLKNAWGELAKVGRRKGSKRRVMCTVVRDMSKYIREWIDFHLIVGWDKVVVYDHQSKDDLSGLLRANYPSDVVEYVPVDWEVRKGGLQRMTKVQTSAFPKCFERYWNQSEALTTTDLDEFMYPAPEHWSEPDSMWKAFEVMGFTSHNVTSCARLRCQNFGFGNYFETPNTSSVVASYSKRAPAKGLEKAETLAGASYQKFCEQCDWDHLYECHPIGNWTNPFCRLCRFCIHVEPLNKTLYFPGKNAFSFTPTIHGAIFNKKADKRHVFDTGEGWKNQRKEGVLCNHYRYRSFTDVRDKTTRNRASGSFLVLARNHSYFAMLNSVHDTTIIDYLIQRRKILKQHGIDI